MPAVIAPSEEVGALVLTLPASGIRLKRADGTIDAFVAWNPATGDVSFTSPVGTNAGGGTRDFYFNGTMTVAESVVIANNLSVGGTITGAVAWGSLTGKPNTIAGYGITDFNALGDARFLKLSGGTLTGNLVLSGGGTAAGSLWKSAVFGIVMQAIAGSTDDLAILTPSGSYIAHVPTGTTNVSFGPTAAQTDALLSARRGGNSFEWGHTSDAGFLSTLGAETSGRPFIALGAEAGTTADTYRTRGNFPLITKLDTATSTVHWGSVGNANANNQAFVSMLNLNLSTGVLSVATPGTSKVFGLYAPVGGYSTLSYVSGATGKWFVGMGPADNTNDFQIYSLEAAKVALRVLTYNGAVMIGEGLVGARLHVGNTLLTSSAGPTLNLETSDLSDWVDFKARGGTFTGALNVIGGSIVALALDGVSTNIQSQSSRTLYINQGGNPVIMGLAGVSVTHLGTTTLAQAVTMSATMSIAGLATFGAGIQVSAGAITLPSAASMVAATSITWVVAGANAMQLDNGATTSGETRQFISLGGGIGLQRMLVGAPGTGPAGSGRMLYTA